MILKQKNENINELKHIKYNFFKKSAIILILCMCAGALRCQKTDPLELEL